MNILVTGCGGFIGNNLVRELQQRYPQARIYGTELWTNGDFFRAPVTLVDWFDQLSVELDLVYHLATRNITECQEVVTAKQVIQYDDYIFRVCADRNIPLVYVSSASVHGNTSERLRTNTPLDPNTNYGAVKAIGELTMRITRPKQSAIVRLTNVYGPWQHPYRTGAGVVAQWCAAIINDKPMELFVPNQVRDYVYVGDVVDELITVGENLLDARDEGTETQATYFIGTGIGTSNAELCFRLGETSGKTFQIHLGDKRDIDVISSRIVQPTTTNPRAYVPLLGGLKETYDWFVNNRILWDMR